MVVVAMPLALEAPTLAPEEPAPPFVPCACADPLAHYVDVFVFVRVVVLLPEQAAPARTHGMMSESPVNRSRTAVVDAMG